MRLFVMTLLLFSTIASAQTVDSEQQAPSPAASTTPPSPLEATPDNRTTPLASSRENRIVSKNEAYNLGRANEGRVGIRLGNDMSYRVTGN
jgi:hypothetical protein